jgi:hypothetical protein
MHWAAKLNHVNMKYDISSPKSESIQRRSISIERLVLTCVYPSCLLAQLPFSKVHGTSKT